VRTLKQRAIALLARREYSRAELMRRLSSAGGQRAELDAVLDELETAGLLSDVRFSVALVEQKRATHGRRAIAYALREKGVEAGQAADALGALDDDDEPSRALALWTRRFGVPPRDDRDKARQIRFLIARGYPGSVAFDVLRKAASLASEDAEST
jgi:regulatory protein